METKDYIIVFLILVVIGGPLAVHVHHKGKGSLRKGPQNTSDAGVGGIIINDTRRLGMAVAAVGGKVVAEGAKLLKRGSLAHDNREEDKKQQKVGGA